MVWNMREEQVGFNFVVLWKLESRPQVFDFLPCGAYIFICLQKREYDVIDVVEKWEDTVQLSLLPDHLWWFNSVQVYTG